MWLSTDKGQETCRGKMGEFLLYSFLYYFFLKNYLNSLPIEDDIKFIIQIFISINIYKADNNKELDTWNSVSHLIFISMKCGRFYFPQYTKELRLRELGNFSNATKIDYRSSPDLWLQGLWS